MNRPYKLPTPPELEILTALYKREPMTIKEIVFITRSEKASNARIQMLHLKGYLKVEAVATHGPRKVNRHSLSPIGEELLAFITRHNL